MIDIAVVRGVVTIDGDDVVSPLICSLEVALSRGRQEVEKHSRARRVSLRTLFRPGVLKGQIVEVADYLQGPVWRGTIMGVSHVVEGPMVYSILDIEKPL